MAHSFNFMDGMFVILFIYTAYCLLPRIRYELVGVVLSFHRGEMAEMYFS